MRPVAVAFAVFAAAIAGGAPAQPSPGPSGPDTQAEAVVEGEATDGPGVTIRIIRDDPSGEVVRWLALNAETTRFTAEAARSLPQQTGWQVAKTLCGFPVTAYWDAFREINRAKLPDPKLSWDRKLGDKAHDYDWPACFWFERGDFSDTVRKDYFASDIYLAATGSPGTAATHAHFFRASNVADVNMVSEGTVLKFPFRSRPVIVVPTGGNKAEFINGLMKTIATAGTKPSEALRTSSTDPIVGNGEIVTAKSDDGNASPAGCVDKPGQAFDLDRVANALNYKLELNQPNSGVGIMVVDNGFFGASRTALDVEFRDLFDRRFFLTARDSLSGVQNIGPTLRLDADTPLYPLNLDNGFAMDAVVTAESGHGTHVVARALGGEARTDPRIFNQDPAQDVWLRTKIAAFSRGQRKIPNLPLSLFSGALLSLRLDGVPAFVNMSLKFGSTAQREMEGLLRSHPHTIFVAAAGNDGRDLDETVGDVFPAVLGGAANLLVVGAEDGLGNLTEFSNRGAGTVDIVAPGCNIRGTLDGLVDGAALSGTSQATPTVTFALALLARRGLRDDRMKARLFLSGDPVLGRIEKAAEGLRTVPVSSIEPAPVRSRSRLNIAKALLFQWDYLRYVDDYGRTVEALGTFGEASGPTCGKGSRTFKKVVAFKQVGDTGQALCFWRKDQEPEVIDMADGEIRDFTVTAVLDEHGYPKPAFQYLDPIPLSRVREFVFSDLRANNTN